METVFISIIVPILTALISYLGARHQSNTELQKVREQQNLEMKQLKETQDAEILKIKEQAFHEIKKIETKMEKQAELYEKNAQTDMASELFMQIMSGDLSGIDNLEKINKIINHSSPKR